jgi:mono/diheme cytochrome c family protein
MARVDRMRRLMKWLGIVVASTVVIVLLAAGVAWYLGGRVMSREHEQPAVTSFPATPHDSLSRARGKHLAMTHGCIGCHGQDLGGQVLLDQLLLGRIVSANLTEKAATYSDTELVRAIRYGVKPDGKSVLVMPSAMFNYLRDDDLAAIIGYVRAQPRVTHTLPSMSVRILGRLGLWTGKFWMDADSVHAHADREPPAPGDTAALGAYIVRTSCTECHGQDLRGSQYAGNAPALAIVGAYDSEQFTRLLRSAVPLNGRTLGGAMAEVVRERLRYFTDDEIAALYTYLHSLGSAPAPNGTTGGS